MPQLVVANLVRDDEPLRPAARLRHLDGVAAQQAVVVEEAAPYGETEVARDGLDVYRNLGVDGLFAQAAGSRPRGRVLGLVPEAVRPSVCGVGVG